MPDVLVRDVDEQRSRSSQGKGQVTRTILGCRAEAYLGTSGEANLT